MSVKKEFIIDHQGKDYVLYAGLLDAAHGAGLKGITTTLVQIPSELNMMTAIVQATVETTGGTFMGTGDASPANVNRMMATAIIRMAETRAKARALRDAINVGVTAFEELAPDHQDTAPVSRPAFAPPADQLDQDDDGEDDDPDIGALERRAREMGPPAGATGAGSAAPRASIGFGMGGGGGSRPRPPPSNCRPSPAWPAPPARPSRPRACPAPR